LEEEKKNLLSDAPGPDIAIPITKEVKIDNQLVNSTL